MNLNEIKLERVTMQTKTKLENLMNLYLHDLSEFADDLKPNEAGKDIDYVIHELFILKGFRNNGIASAAIENLMSIYKGKYKVGQIISNKKAVNFWKMFYKKHNIEYKESEEVFDGIECIEQKF